MPKNSYKGVITFEEGYKETFEQFKARFENCWVFREMEAKVKSVELKKAFEIASKDTKATDK